MANADSNWIPREGMEFSSTEEAWNFWRFYSGQMGFNARKHYANKSKKDNVVTSRRFLCSKQGHRENDKRDHLVIEPRPETRTDCSARMGIILNRSTGKYYVHEFIPEHNHLLHYAECTHMLSSQRAITDVQAFEIQLANDSGLTQKNSFDFFSNQAGGRANLGFTQRDQKNYLRSRRQREMGHGEVGFLLYYFQKKTLEDPSFFYAVQLDNSEQVTNIFWADARMRFDYELFGDVISFDTTFATNKEYRPFGVFTGFNQYRGIIIFGAALLYDETIDSFIWLFETFLEAHNHKKPKTMFTDQDAAMSNAIGQVIPETRHGLCTWHLMQNGIKHLGNLMKDGSFFLSNFKKIMFEYENEEKFEVAWNELLSSFSVEDNSWLASIYKIKEKWAKCYMKTAVTLGMRSTQLSESLNGDLKDYLKSNFDLGSFFKQFERVIDDKRYKELQAEFDSREKMPRLRVKSLPLLQQAGSTYTPLIFEKFQEEWEKSLSTFVKHRHEDNAIVIASFIEEGEYMVSCNKINETVTCRCMKFDMFGILCSHALKVLDLLDIKSIPEKYILRRWTRCARNEIMEKTNRDIEGSIKSDMADRYKELCPMLVKLASKASKTEEGYLLLKEEIKKMNNHLDENQNSQCHENYIKNAYMSVPLSERISHTAMDHLLINSKGLKKKEGRKGGKRLKSWVEKQPKKREKRTNFLKLKEVDKQVFRLPTQLSTSTSFSGVFGDSSLFVDKEGFNFLKL